MFNNKKEWNPYYAGALLGLVAIISVIATTLFLGKANYLGASTTFVRGSGFVMQWFYPEETLKNAYYIKEKIKLDWQFMLVIGIFIGAYISSKLDKSFKLESVPPLWSKNFGPSTTKRAIFSIIGGVIAIIGARMAGGCPSGHGLSGMMQLSFSSFISMIMFFSIGVVTAHIIYKKKDVA